MYNPVVIRSNRCEDFERSKPAMPNLNSHGIKRKFPIDKT